MNIGWQVVGRVCRLKGVSMGIIAAILFAAQPMRSQSAEHPLDALTAPEYWTATEVLHAAGKTDAKSSFPMIQLKEPPKKEVLAWKPGQPLRREAFLMVEQGRQVFEAVVDIGAKKLVSWTEIKGVQPPYVSLAQEGEIDSAVKDNAEMVAALKKRGITDLNTVFCGGYSAGYFGAPEEKDKRLLRTICLDIRGGTEGAGRRRKGLTVFYEENEGRVLGVMEKAIVPLQKVP